MKNDESSHELENNTNDFAIRMLYILRHTLFFDGGMISWIYLTDDEGDYETKKSKLWGSGKHRPPENF